MNHGSLFSGIGGFDLAAERMGWTNVFHCEWMDFPRKVLHHYWPEATSYVDITRTDFTLHAGQIDVLTGGFPCQPYSAAGKRKGKDDDRHLWPHMLRAIREIRPRYVVGENVFGLTTWNGGVVLEEVCADLEAEGYAVQPFIIPAAAVGAPHRRDRVWIVAYCKNIRWDGRECEQRENTNENYSRIYEHRQERCKVGGKFERYSKERNATNTDNNGHPPAKVRQCMGEGDDSNATRSQHAVKSARCADKSWHATDSPIARLERSGGTRNRSTISCQQSNWQDFPTVAPICSGDDGLPRELDGITFPKWRNESIKGYGNAIVPQVAMQIFAAIEQYEQLTEETT